MSSPRQFDRPAMPWHSPLAIGICASILCCTACSPDPGRSAADDSAESPPTHATELVAALDIASYKRTIERLAASGDRRTGSSSYYRAARWIENELAAAGYTVEHHEYEAFSRDAPHNEVTRSNLYVTKIGSTRPDEMLIVSAHLDGMGGGGGADDDASGSALVLEAARAFANAAFETERSIRFVFWNGEETGRVGSRAYVSDRAGLQGIESPAGSGLYPEPRWVGVIQHDMLLYDHGVPPGPGQIAAADIDIEYQGRSEFAAASLGLAQVFLEGNRAFSSDYPAEIGDNMEATDSVSFAGHTAAISVRENQRVAEIGRRSNPHWHQPTDVYTSYSEADFRLGFNAVQMTVGTVARLAGDAGLAVSGDE